MKLFELFATLGLDTGEFDEGVEGAGEKGKGLGEKIDKAMGVAKKAIVAVGIGAALTGLKNDLLAAADAGDKVDKASQQLGMSRKAYQEWGYVLGQNGANIDSMGVSMKTLQNAMVQGTEATDSAFQALGLNINDIKNMAPEDAFGAVVTALQGMPAGAEKTALAIDLLGKNAMELMPLLNQTAEGTDALKQEANDLGMVLGDDAVDAGVEFGDALDKLKKSMAGTLTQGLTKLLPGITKFIDKLTPIINKILPKLIDAFGKVLEAVWPLIEDGLNFLADALEWVADNIDWLLPVIAALSAAFLVLNVIMNANPISLIIIGIAALIAGIVLLIQNFDAVSAWFAGIGQWIYDNVIQPIVGFFTALWASVSTAATNAWNWIVSVWTAVSTWFNDNVIVPVSDFFTGLWSAITTAATDTWDAIVAVWTVVAAWFTDNIITPISTAFTPFWTGISSAASTAWNAIVLAWEGAKKWFDDTVIGPIASAFTSFWNGISTAAKSTWDAIVGWISQATTDIKAFLGLSEKASGMHVSSGGNTFSGRGAGFSTGLDYVPNRGSYTLDPGEAVLTKLEADNWRKGGQQSVVGATAQDIAAAVAAAMQNVRVLMDGKTVGTLVAATVSSVIGETAQTMRYA